MISPPLKVNGVAEVIRVLGEIDILRGMNHPGLRRFQLDVQLDQEPTPVDRRLSWFSSPPPSLWAGRRGSGEGLVDCFFHVVDLEHFAFFVDGLQLPSVDC